MRRLVVLCAAAAFVAAFAPSAAGEELVPADGSCWQRVAPRSQNAPAGELRSTANGYILASGSGGKPNVYGGWCCATYQRQQRPSAYERRAR